MHTYGIGLAIAFYVAYRYFERRLRRAGEPYEWVSKSFLWIIAAAIVGARVVHVVANISFYAKYPGQILLIWHGGLSSFGGLAAAIPTGIYFVKRYAPSLKLARAFDILAPVLMLAWSIGRILGPQLMYQGGGRVTNAWYGMQYAGQVGYRIPVPIFQATEDFVIFLVLLKLERSFSARTNKPPLGTLALTMVAMWSVTRFWDEFFWLAVPRVWDAVEVFSILLLVASIVALVVLQRKSPSAAIDAIADQSQNSEPTSLEEELADNPSQGE